MHVGITGNGSVYECVKADCFFVASKQCFCGLQQLNYQPGKDIKPGVQGLRMGL